MSTEVRRTGSKAKAKAEAKAEAKEWKKTPDARHADARRRLRLRNKLRRQMPDTQMPDARHVHSSQLTPHNSQLTTHLLLELYPKEAL